MGLNVVTLAVANKFTEDTVIGMGAIKGDKGENGTNGKDGNTPYIQNDYWYIDGVNTNILAKGTNGINGKDGTNGIDGSDGIDGINGIDGQTPYIKDGFWYIGNINTNVKAIGLDGTNGINGSDGIDGINGIDGKNGSDGFSPIISVKTDTKTEYILDIETKDGTITTPNLQGKDGESSGATKEYVDAQDLKNLNDSKIYTDEKITEIGTGDDGATFTPVPTTPKEDTLRLEWTNNKNLVNPSPVEIKAPKGSDGISGTNGADGFTPVISVNTSTDDSYILDIENKDGTITTPNLKGSSGRDGVKGDKGDNATINNVNTLTIVNGNNITLTQTNSTLTISSDITVPTKVSELINDSNYDTVSSVDNKILNAGTSANTFTTESIATHNIDESSHSNQFQNKADVSSIGEFIKNVTYNNTNGVFTFTKYDNTTITIDTPLEEIVKSGYYEESTKSLVLVLANNQEIKIPVSGLIDLYTGQTSATIQVAISSDNKITANIISGSITRLLLATELQTSLTSLETQKHTHANKNVIDTISQTLIDKWNSTTTSNLYTANLGLSWVGSVPPYTQTVAVNGLLATDTPIIDIVVNSDVVIGNKQIESWLAVNKIICGINSITAYCYSEKPIVALPIQIKVIK